MREFVHRVAAQLTGEQPLGWEFALYLVFCALWALVLYGLARL